MAAIAGHVASSIRKILDDLEAKLVPFLRDTAREAASGGVGIAQETAEQVLTEVTEKLNALKTTVDQHAPDSGQ